MTLPNSLVSALMSYEAGEFTAAMASACDVPPSSDVYHVARLLYCRCLARLGRFDEAAVAYTAFLTVFRDEADAWLELGEVFCRQGKPESALWSFTRLREAVRDDWRGEAAAALLCEDRGRLSEATAHWQRAVALSKQGSQAVAESAEDSDGAAIVGLLAREAARRLAMHFERTIGRNLWQQGQATQTWR